MKSDFTRAKRCQCVFPNDCGQGGCAATCSPTVSVTDIETEGQLHHTRTLTSELVSTCCSRCEPINFDFGNGYNWLVSAWPYITDCQGPPLYVVLPARSPFRFCIVDDDGCPGGGSGYRYSPGCCQAECASISSSTPPGADALTYRLQYVEADDSFVFTDGQDIWRFLGFRPDRVEKGRFKSYESGGRKAQAAGYTDFGHITRINFLDTTGALSSFLEYAYTTFAEAAGQIVERLVTATYSVVSGGQDVPVRRVHYTYYMRSDAPGSGSSSSSSSAAGDEFGTLGDLCCASH